MTFILTVSTMLVQRVQAFDEVTDAQIASMITQSGFKDNTVIAVSLRDGETGNILFAHQDHLLLHPASLLKLFSSAYAISVLGEDFSYPTILEKLPGEDIYVLNYSGDPLFTEKQLQELLTPLSGRFIDRLIVHSTLDIDLSWNQGWMIEDILYLSPLSALSINENNETIYLVPDKSTKTIKVESLYGKLRADTINSVEYNTEKSDIEVFSCYKNGQISYLIKGFLCEKQAITLPVKNSIDFFRHKIAETMAKQNISAQMLEVGKNLYCQDSTEVLSFYDRPLEALLHVINAESNNRVAETVFRTALKKDLNQHCYNQEEPMTLFYDYLTSLGLARSEFKFVDACGMSHYNLLTADTVTLFLYKIKDKPYFKPFQNSLAEPLKEGTLLHRLDNIKDNLHGKTGTLSGISNIAGYMKTKKGKTIIFTIMIQNFTRPTNDARAFQDKVLTYIHEL